MEGLNSLTGGKGVAQAASAVVSATPSAAVQPAVASQESLVSASPAVAPLTADVEQPGEHPASNSATAEVAAEAQEKPAETPVIQKESRFFSKTKYHLEAPTDYEGEPFKIDGEVVEKLILTKKRPMELTGISIASVGEGDIDAVVELLQRSCTPSLSFEDASNLDLWVITQAAGVFKSFFMGTQSVT